MDIVTWRALFDDRPAPTMQKSYELQRAVTETNDIGVSGRACMLLKSCCKSAQYRMLHPSWLM